MVYISGFHFENIIGRIDMITPASYRVDNSHAVFVQFFNLFNDHLPVEVGVANRYGLREISTIGTGTDKKRSN